MENSGAIAPNDAKMADSGEESSWTFYIQGFTCHEDHHDDDHNSSFSNSEYESPSLVSDAASSAVKKFANIGFSTAAARPLSKQNSLKKQKTRAIPSAAMGNDLEDTASSPANSPKNISYMNQFMSLKEKAKMDVSQKKKKNIFGKDGIMTVERDTDYTEYSKKNTCG